MKLGKFTKKRALWAGLLLVGVLFYRCLPNDLFPDPTCTVIDDRNGKLLGATIASDGQWRFPHCDTVPEKFETAITTFEDRHFYHHPGFNPVSMFRALRLNISAGRVVSGGSTISMQVIRMSRKGQPRTVLEKLWEVILAVRMELGYSKKEILALYASNAPFGGNVVGLEAAAWRYYGRAASTLSWSETATLAVLPNAPSLIFPGRNQELLHNKRNRLLVSLLELGHIDSLTCELAKEEPLPGKPLALPNNALHLLTRSSKEGFQGTRTKTTVDTRLQEQVQQVVERHHRQLSENEIHNIALVVVHVESGETRAYVGNTKGRGHGNQVDVITAPRSTGSIIKPLLYASMNMDGDILPERLVADIPTHLSGYAPKNFDETFDGAVPADEALSRSLNIPAVRMLNDYGLERFYHKLKKLPMTTFNRPADQYGLSLILGGAETNLWELCGVYASMARTLNHYTNHSGRYFASDFRMPHYTLDKPIPASKAQIDPIAFDAGSIWLTFEALQALNRPTEEIGWQYFQSSRNLAWKTGTSFGYRDAWALGITPQYVVGVWVGNADGEGRPGLTGVTAAAPILFDVFKLLPDSAWFEQPYDNLERIPVCGHSGYRVGINCDPIDTTWVHPSGLRTAACPYHELVHLDATGTFRVNNSCVSVNEMQHQPWFVLPPIMEWFYRNKNANYRPLPPYAHGCQPQQQGNSMDIIYPRELTQIYIPRELDGTMGRAVFEIAHRKPSSTVHWHLDSEYLGSTSALHQMELVAIEGKHILTLVDEEGATLVRQFEIVGK